jgi:glucose-1-phosphate cytidylyltransferase
MKLVILAGGLGTRFAEETHSKPKPMIKILGRPIIWYIMKHYSHYKIKDFIICGGYKWKIIEKYFLSKSKSNKIIYQKGKIVGHNFILKKNKWNVKLINTGKSTMTGGRIAKIKKYLDISDENFCLTYGDGISDINISKLIKFHNKQKLLATVLAVRPPSRFGSLTIKNKKVTNFSEKNKNSQSLINGGFFILSKMIFKFIKNSSTVFEEYPLKKLASLGQLGSYYHTGYWMPMDTLREKKLIEKYIKDNKDKLTTWF